MTRSGPAHPSASRLAEMGVKSGVSQVGTGKWADMGPGGPDQDRQGRLGGDFAGNRGRRLGLKRP